MQVSNKSKHVKSETSEFLFEPSCVAKINAFFYEIRKCKFLEE